MQPEPSSTPPARPSARRHRRARTGGPIRVARTLSRTLSRTVDPRPSVRLLVLAVLVVLAGLQTPLAPADVPDRSAEQVGATPRVDPRLDQDTCRLLGRAWTGGCSTGRCRRPGDYIRAADNAEVCALGGRRGARYGTFVPIESCRALHRTWVAAVNVCVSEPRRTLRAVADGPGCVAPYTSYVLLHDVEDDYDECVRPHRLAELRAIAAQEGRTLRAVASERSKALCALRYDTVFRDGRCQDAETTPVSGATAEGTLVIGDSVVWRAGDELTHARPSWTVDVLPGRNVRTLGERIGRYLRSRPAPATLVVALGTNPSRSWGPEDYQRAVEVLPAESRVLFVLPFRDRRHNAPGVTARVARNATWMRAAARARPGSCVADWRARARQRPSLLVDGTHPTPRGERVLARFLTTAWATCQEVPTASGAPRGA